MCIRDRNTDLLLYAAKSLLQRQLHIITQIIAAPEMCIRDRYKKLAEIANMNLVVKNYVEAEYRLAVLVGDIQRIIAEAIEVEK